MNICVCVQIMSVSVHVMVPLCLSLCLSILLTNNSITYYLCGTKGYSFKSLCAAVCDIINGIPVFFSLRIITSLEQRFFAKRRNAEVDELFLLYISRHISWWQYFTESPEKNQFSVKKYMPSILVYFKRHVMVDGTSNLVKLIYKQNITILYAKCREIY